MTRVFRKCIITFNLILYELKLILNTLIIKIRINNNKMFCKVQKFHKVNKRLFIILI
jgi:hypothetical protein